MDMGLQSLSLTCLSNSFQGLPYIDSTLSLSQKQESITTGLVAENLQVPSIYLHRQLLGSEVDE